MSASDRQFSEDDEGKTVVTDAGKEIGVVRDVRAGVAFVEPMASLDPTIMAELGWGGDDRDAYRLDEARVDAVTEDTVMLLDP